MIHKLIATLPFGGGISTPSRFAPLFFVLFCLFFNSSHLLFKADGIIVFTDQELSGDYSQVTRSFQFFLLFFLLFTQLSISEGFMTMEV